ncbi:MAG: BatA domain-containing protein, partial [Pseudomonadota bacterium]
MSLGALSFLSPLLLTALIALPVIYWLLRTTPPRPRQIRFPATRILVGLENKEKTPDTTPWWLMLLRMLAAAAIIFALAEPVLNPERSVAIGGSGPVVVVVDNGWSSGDQWAERQAALERTIGSAEAQRRAVVIVPTAEDGAKTTLAQIAPADARRRAAALIPQPFAPNRSEALERLAPIFAAAPDAAVVWLSDGIDHGAAGAFASGLAEQAGGGVTVVAPQSETALGVFAELGEGGVLQARIVRSGGGAEEGLVHALSARGERLSEARFKFGVGQKQVETTFDLPLELRNQVSRVAISGERSAGAVQLLDGRTRWNRIGLISGANQEQTQPLLGPLYYIRRALAPFSELVDPKAADTTQGIRTILQQNATVLALADIGRLSEASETGLTRWVERGGVLLRFAGPRLEQGGDALLPVDLREGGRALGGALSWSEPQALAPFAEESLFAGLEVPPDVRVRRQVLAEPASMDAATLVWARLADGTPLVTARRQGNGHVVLFHITANSDWSNLPLSGLFVGMLRRIATLGASQST